MEKPLEALQRLQARVEQTLKRWAQAMKEQRAEREERSRKQMEELDRKFARALKKLEGRMEKGLKKLAEVARRPVGWAAKMEERIRALERSVAELRRRVERLEERPGQLRCTKRAISVKTPSGRWASIPRARFLRLVRTAARLGEKGTFTAHDLLNRSTALKQLKAGASQARNFLSILEAMGLVKAVSRGAKGKVYQLSVPASELPQRVREKVKALEAG